MCNGESRKNDGPDRWKRRKQQQKKKKKKKVQEQGVGTKDGDQKRNERVKGEERDKERPRVV